MHRIDKLEPVLRLEALVLLLLDQVHQDIFYELCGGISGSRRRLGLFSEALHRFNKDPDLILQGTLFEV